jgi:hypothetical protein
MKTFGNTRMTTPLFRAAGRPVSHRARTARP